jgi:hypothetical protein
MLVVLAVLRIRIRSDTDLFHRIRFRIENTKIDILLTFIVLKRTVL